jgi:hypothetical protein
VTVAARVAPLPQSSVARSTCEGIDNAEIIETVFARRAQMIPVSASLRL